MFLTFFFVGKSRAEEFSLTSRKVTWLHIEKYFPWVGDERMLGLWALTYICNYK